MKQSKLIIITVAIAIIFALIGFSLGRVSMNPTIAKYKKIIDLHDPVTELEELLNISGKITEIKDNILSVETIVHNPYELPENQKPETYKVVIGEATKILKIEMPFDPLGETKETELSLKDLKINDNVFIQAGENIKNKKEFEAKSIRLNISPEAPEMPEVETVPETSEPEPAPLPE